MCEDNLCSKCGYKFPRPIEDALRAELDKRKPIPVSERMPEIHKDLLLYDSWKDRWTIGYLTKLFTDRYQWTTGGFYYHDDNFSRVTHWMPLPPAPEVEP